VSLGDRLAELTTSLVDVASESRDEEAIVSWIRERIAGVPHLRSADDEDTVLLYLPEPRHADAPLVLLAGHVDTVPLGGAARPGRRGGDAVIGRGAADMKGALAVMLALAEDGSAAGDLDLGYLFFGREELPIGASALLPLFDRCPEVRETALALVMEPTANAIEAGCTGNLNARITIRGRAAHSARPWLGENAIHTAFGALASLAHEPVRAVDIDGLTYREVTSVTTIQGGIAANVVPDRVVAHVNVRYAPDRSPASAEAGLRELLSADDRVELEILGNAPPGPVARANPLVERLRATADLPVGPKQAWTPVAEFGLAAIDAVNFGPGDPRYAHADDECVEVAALVRTHEILTAFLAGASEGER
jgi:succinyl-diaminopimelate desuccinylase